MPCPTGPKQGRCRRLICYHSGCREVRLVKCLKIDLRQFKLQTSAPASPPYYGIPKLASILGAPPTIGVSAMFVLTKTTPTVCLIALLCLSTACTTMRPIATGAVGDSIRQEIKPGDTVRVVTKSGPVRSFQITEVGATSLGGNAVKIWGGGADPVGTRIDVQYSEVTELDVKRTSGLKTAGLIAAALLIVVAVASGGGSHEVGYSGR